MSTPNNSAPSWLSVSGGKWHQSVSPEPTFTRDERTQCGLTVRPLNVTWHEPPPTSPRWLCVRCLKLGTGA